MELNLPVSHPVINECHAKCAFLTENTILLAALSFISFDSCSEGVKISAIEAQAVKTEKKSGTHCCGNLIN